MTLGIDIGMIKLILSHAAEVPRPTRRQWREALAAGECQKRR
jgi:hypothetical protein